MVPPIARCCVAQWRTPLAELAPDNQASAGGRAPTLAGDRTLLANMIFGALLRLWRAGLQLVFTPIFIHMLGPESYGLVAFNATLLMVVMFLEQAVSPVVLREFGRLGGDPANALQMRDLLRSMELISVSIALTIGIGVMLLAPWLARDILDANSLDTATVTAALQLMGLSLATQWPSLLYSSCFVGLGRQGRLTAIGLIGTSLQVGGTALLLWLVRADILVFFLWQAVAGALTTVALGLTVWRVMPPAKERPRVSVARLRQVFVFAMGTMGIGVTTSLLTQADKLVMSDAVTLAEFSAYAMAFFLVSQVQSLATSPVAIAMQPHLARLVTAERAVLAREYHRWTRILWSVCLVVLGMLAAFPTAFLGAWLGPASPLVSPVAQLLPVVAVGTMLNTLMTMPFLLQMATGWVRLSLVKNVLALAVVLPGLAFLVPRYGVMAGAGLWLALNLGYVLIEVPLMHRRLLRGELLRWWVGDALVPGALAAALYALAATVVPVPASRFLGVVPAALVALAVAVVLVLTQPSLRRDAWMLVHWGARVLRQHRKEKDISACAA